LYEDGWHAASALSEAPTWGGGSWMSYTSALFGVRIDTHPQFLSFFDQYQANPYPDLGHYLKSQGYEYVRVSSLSVEMEAEEWLKYKIFYGVDRWMNYGDLNFQGLHYGWGPSPPDQYALHFAHEAINSVSNKPVFMFFITQNSHYPWVPLPEVVDDWRTLNVRAAEERAPTPDPILHEIRRRNYLNAIEYELGFLTDFILKTGDDNSVYVLIGDHQPQRVSRRSDGFDTPIHIISKDLAFADSFLDYGFVRGLIVRDFQPTVRHEGFHSMFVRALLAQYGKGMIRILPDYLPGGINLKDDAS
jgi:phosphoglycerol transferase MdoB-like AlkP superfamily enzyme